MCGIVGQINVSKPIDIDIFIEMRDTMIHRGPDNGGYKIINNNKVALGHRRLSIIDLSYSGNQPLTNEDKTIFGVVNGEIYNYLQLRMILEKKGHTFYSNSDSEIIIHGYEEWGEELPNYLKGMFAFAIWNDNNKTLFLARDRFGIKPLYYYFDNKSFIFASEIKAIIKNPNVKHTLNFQSITDFFIYRFIPSPNSIWNEINKIPPSHSLKFSNNGNISIKKYWNLKVKNKRGDQTELIQKTGYLLEKSIKEHLLSDVPIGTFLSGGYDSSSIVYYLNKLGYTSDSYAIGFQNWKLSEHKYAKIVSDIFGTNHHEKIIDYNSIDLTKKLAYYFDEPIGGFSFIPTFLVSEFAAKNNKVVLSGDGGDELLAGYNWYYKIAKKWQTLTYFNRKLLNKKQFLLSEYFNQMSWSGFNSSNIKRLIDGNHNFKAHDLELYNNKYIGNGFIKNLQIIDINSFMSELILTKVDRASMANSLEVRVPFLDHELFEYIFQFDERFYFKSNYTKYLLHENIKHVMPKSILNKPKKGFGMPYNSVANFDRIKDIILNAKSVKDEIINKIEVNKLLLNKDSKKLWAIFIFENWYATWN